MWRFTASLLAVSLLVTAGTASAEEPSVVAPFRFTGPTKELSPMDRARALSYRTQLQDQLRTLDQKDLGGRLDPLARRRLLDTRGELGRINGLVGGSSRPSDLGSTGSKPLPSLSPSLLRRSP